MNTTVIIGKQAPHRWNRFERDLEFIDDNRYLVTQVERGARHIGGQTEVSGLPVYPSADADFVRNEFGERLLGGNHSFFGDSGHAADSMCDKRVSRATLLSVEECLVVGMCGTSPDRKKE